MKTLAILGASGHGKVVADMAECSGWNSIEFFDDNWPTLQRNGHWSVVGNTSALLERLEQFAGVVVAIGANNVRHLKLLELHAAGARLCTLIHPAATVSRYASIDYGSVVFAGAVVSADASIGSGAILNTGCSVDHDCVLGSAVHISPGARLAGGVNVGNQSWIGIGANVRQMVSIGSGSTIGAGAAVVSNIGDNMTAVGVPALTIN